MKKILIISRTIFENGPQPIRFNKFIRNWLGDSKITLLTYSESLPIHNEGLIDEIKIVTINKNFITKIIAPSVKVQNLSIEQKSNKKFLKRLFKLVRFRKAFFPDVFLFSLPAFKKKIKYLSKYEKYDVVIISAFPFSFQALGRYARKYLIDTKLIYDTGDPFYKNSSKTTQGLLHKSLSRVYENYMLKAFDYIVVPSNILMKHYINNFPFLNKEKVKVIPQGIDRFIPESFAQKSGKNSFLSLIYAGRFYKGLREPFEFYKAADSFNNLLIDFYGDFVDEFKIKRDNIRFHSSIKNNFLIDEYVQRDAIVFFDNKEGIQLPGKIFEILALKKPILFIYENLDSPALEIVKDFDFVIKTLNKKESIIKAIDQLIYPNKEYNFCFKINPYFWDNLALEYQKLF